MIRRRARAARRDRLMLLGLACAYGAFAMTFRGPRAAFWRRMTMTGATLGSIALAADASLRNLRASSRDVARGAASAAGLYGIFRVGDTLARRIMPAGGDDIGDVYALRTLESPAKIAMRLALVIAPAEELFWRGFVQHRLEREHGAIRGAAMATAAYGGAHLAAGNMTLIGASTVAGAYWSSLLAAGASMESLITSHVLWDIVIFLVAPTAPSPRR